MVDIEKLLAELTLEEKVSLLAGVDTWRTVPIPRLSIPSVKVGTALFTPPPLPRSIAYHDSRHDTILTYFYKGIRWS
jgi:hypothetical protein